MFNWHKKQYQTSVKYKEEIIMIWEVFSAQRITPVLKVEDVIYKDISKTHVIIY